MLKIIKEGKKRKTNVKKFVCDNCGCIFETDEFKDYQIISQEVGHWITKHYCNCPNCNHRVF